MLIDVLFFPQYKLPNVQLRPLTMSSLKNTCFQNNMCAENTLREFATSLVLVILCEQGSKIALVRSYLRVPPAAGQVKILIFLVKIKFFPIYANDFCDAGQVTILRYFKAW